MCINYPFSGKLHRGTLKDTSTYITTFVGHRTFGFYNAYAINVQSRRRIETNKESVKRKTVLFSRRYLGLGAVTRAAVHGVVRRELGRFTFGIG